MSITILSQGKYIPKKASGELDFEKQFAQIAYASVLQKMPILSPYTVGFETVDVNEDGTEGVGVMIFLIDTKTLFVPAWYQDSQLTTGVVMIEADKQRVLPCREDLISDIREKAEQAFGEEADDRDISHIRRGSPSATQIRDYLDPISKTATLAPSKEALADAFTDMIAEGPFMKTASCLDLTLAMGKEATDHLLEMLSKNAALVQDVLTYYKPSDIQEFTKTAAELYGEDPVEQAPKHRATLITPFDKTASLVTGKDRETFLKQGYLVKLAEDAEPSRIAVDEVGATPDLSTFTAPGLYELLQQDGTFLRALLLFKPENGDACCRDSRYDSRDKEYVCITDNMPSDRYLTVKSSTLGALLPISAAQLAGVIEGVGKPLIEQARLSYGVMLAMPDGSVYRVPSTMYSQGDGNRSFSNADTWGEFNTITVSDVVKKAYLKGKTLTVPATARVLEDAMEKLRSDIFDSMSRDDRNKMTEAQDRENSRKIAQEYKNYGGPFCTISDMPRTLRGVLAKDWDKVTVSRENGKFSITPVGKFEAPVGELDGLTEKQAALHLVDTFGCSPEAASVMLGAVQEERGFAKTARSFYLQKKAIDQNPGYGFGSSPYDISNTASYELYPEPPVKVDALGSAGMGVIGESKEQIMDAVHRAAEKGVKEVFDVSLIKMVVNTTNATNVIGDYMGDMMKILDKLGRMIMLFYSHKEAFSKQYGESRLGDLIETTKNAMDNVADLVVFLRNRSILQIDLTSDGSNDLTTGTTL